MRIARFLFLMCIGLPLFVSAQENGKKEKIIDYQTPVEYEIGGITISGAPSFDVSALLRLSGLTVGEKIDVPGEDIAKAIEKYWDQGLFETVDIKTSAIRGKVIFIDIFLTERPRLARFSIKGVRKTEADNVREDLTLVRGDVVTENLIIKTKNSINNHFIGKGFLDVRTDITTKPDSANPKNVILSIDINKGKRIRINEIVIHGNESLETNKAKRQLKETKENKIINIFKGSKFIENNFDDDKHMLIAKYNELGYRDARITKDSIYRFNEKTVNIDLFVDEGKKYYFRDIDWIGNTKYSDAQLSSIVKINKGDVFNQQLLDKRLYMNMEGADVSSLYLDDGYLFFNLTPVEVSVDGDSIDLEIRIYEGKQARIRKVTVTGNERTNDHVIIREIRSKPGMLFSRADIIRTQQFLSQLGYFNQESINVNPKPNPVDGTVDLEFIVEETSSDQVELSGGWGAGGVIGTLGLSFNNFSINNLFNKEAWRPLPIGDGQKLSIRAQSNGRYYQGYNFSFTEPWLGGKKPNALSISVYHSAQTYNPLSADSLHQKIKITGATVGLGRRLQWPDENFTFYTGITYQHYLLKDYPSTFLFSNGNSNNLNLNINLSRNAVDGNIYPKSGSQVSLSAAWTPPYSSINNKVFGKDIDYSTLADEDKYRWIEYQKYKFNATWYTKLAGNLVLSTRTKFGFLGLYNNQIGVSPFERFYLGGDGLSGWNLDGRELIGMRGYTNNTLTPTNSLGSYIGGSVYTKYTMELRYPISLNPMATVYGLAFFEAGNAWSKFQEFNPFDVKRSAGFGLRVYLPMFGLLGLDWGYGFDEIYNNPNANKGQIHFSINQSLD